MSEKLSDNELGLDDESPGFGQVYDSLSAKNGTTSASNTSRTMDSEQGQAWQKWQVALVARSIMGDEQAFALIADHYGNLLLRTAYLLVRDEEAAKDIVQDSLLLAWKHMTSLREPAFLRTWLLKIVINQSTSLKRQWARKAALLREQFAEQAIELAIEQSDFQRGRVEDHLDIERAIEQLPLHQRTVLVLFYYHRMTIPEIATMLNASENTLRKRLQAALSKLRRVLRIELDSAHPVSLTARSITTHVSLHRGDM